MGHTVQTGEMRNTYRTSAEKHHRTKPYGILGKDGRIIFKIHFREIGYEDGTRFK